MGAPLKRRQRGQEARVIAHAWKAQHRLYKLFHRVAARRGPQVAAVAVARELVGFIWAALRLARLFGTTPEFWLNGQRNWDLWQAMHAPESDEIEQIEPVSA